VVRRGIALLAMGVALVAATARAQPAQVVLAPTVYATHAVPSNAITAFTVTCPPGYLAASAGISKPAPGTTVLALAPVGVSAYRFRIGNPATNGDQRATVAVACRKVRPAAVNPRFTLKLTPLKVKYLTVSPRRASSAALVCPPGTVPAGAGVDVAPGRQKATGAYRPGPGVSVRRQTATLRRFSFSLLNLEPRAKRVAVYGGCLTLAREAGAPRERLHVKVTTFRVLLDPGSQAVTRRCRSGWISLAAGYALRSKSTNAAGAAAVAAAGRWSLLSDADGATTADVQLACARLAP
jgi:hypothetical protein